MAGLAGSQFSDAQKGPGYVEYSAWTESVEGNPIYSEKNQSDFIYYSMMGYNDPVDWTIVNNVALTFNESDLNYDQLTLSGSGGIFYGYTKFSLAHYEALAMQRILSLASSDGSLASFQVEISYPGRIRWNKNDQAKMAIHTINWIRYAEATNYGSFDLHAAFSSFDPNIDSGNQGFSVLAFKLAVGGRSFGFSASSALFVNTRGEYNSIVNFNANEQWHQWTGPDGELWEYNINRNGKGSNWGTQKYNFVLINNLLYPND